MLTITDTCCYGGILKLCLFMIADLDIAISYQESNDLRTKTLRWPEAKAAG